MSNIIRNRKIFTSASGSSGLSPADEARLSTLENNVYKVAYFTEINSASGTITKPTGSTILENQFPGGVDALVSTISTGQPTGINPVTAGGVAVDVTSFDTSGNFTLTGTPSSFPVALIYIISIPAVSWSNLTTNNILEYDPINQVQIAAGSIGDTPYRNSATTWASLTSVSAGSYKRSGGIGTAPSWSTAKLLNTLTANYIPYNSATNTQGESANLQFDGTSLTVGGSALVSSTDVARFHRNQNGGTVFYLTNATSGTAARSEYYSSADNGSTALFMGMNSAGYTTSGIRVAGASTIGSTSSVGFNIGTATNVPVALWTNNTERVRLLSTGEMVIGASTLLGTELLSVQKNQNAITQFAVSNSTAGTASRAAFTCYTTGTTGITLGAQSSSYTTSGMFIANTSTIHTTQSGGLNIGSVGGAYPVSIWINNAKKVDIDANANVILNSSGSALATNATNGFTYIPTCAGTPTGVPATLPTGALPIIIDSTNNKMYIYSGGAWVALN